MNDLLPAKQFKWEPLPGLNGKPSAQAIALSCPCNHILFDGTRGPGKTDTQLMYFRQFVGQGYGQFWTGIIFDRTYKMLDDLVKKSNRWFARFGTGGARYNRSETKWVWPTGEQLLFRHMKDPSDYENYHGHEYPYIGWNELTKSPTSELYDLMMSCNRSSFIPEEHSPIDPETGRMRLLPPIPLVVFSTTNPHGPGHNWVKRRFIDPTNGKSGRIVRVTRKVYNPQTQQEENITKTQARIFGSYKENRYLSPEYVLELDAIKDPNKRAAWLEGNWDIEAGGALEGVWNRAVHRIPRFAIPSTWRLSRSFDWGSTHPFSVGFWARANGEEVVLPNGLKWAPVAGSLIRIAEWYGSEEIGTNKGIKMSARNIAVGIKERITRLRENNWIAGEVRPGPADSQIYAVTESESNSIASKMAEEGITWVAADKRAGSRKNGLQLLRDALENAVGDRQEDGTVIYERPGIYIMENCTAWLETVPNLPRDEDDPDDVDTTAEDHTYDDTRYMILHNIADFATSIDIQLAHR